MTKEILKRLFFSFLISFVTSIIYLFLKRNESSDESFRFNIVLIVSINIINLALSLTALLNLNKKVQSSYWKSFFSFFSLPILFLLIIYIKVLSLDLPYEKTIEDFIFILHPSVIFCLSLFANFRSFRRTLK